MKKLKDLVDDMMYGDIVRKIAEEQNVGLTKARNIISQMSFKDYRIAEATVITPPSGNTISPSTQPQQPSGTTSVPTDVKAIWPGKGAPVEVGMTVGLKGPNGLPVPGTVGQVDMSAKGVKVKNSTTGQDEWMNLDTLEPFMADQQASHPGQPIQPNANAVAEDVALARMLQLAGIQENCSGGATGAGAIAIAPAAMGKIKKRQYPEESLQTEYTPKGPAKTIAGDTKPAQASGKLSADLAASGKASAGRINNGRKRR